MEERTELVPVLIAGAGPAGLAAAITLRRYGIGCTIVDRRSAVWPMPRATVVSTRTMELARAWGVDHAIRAGGVDVEIRLAVCRTLAEVATGHTEPVGYPTKAQSELVSPVHPECVPQDHVEQALVDHLVTLGVRVLRGVEVVDVHTTAAGVRVTLRDADGRSHRIIEARYLIAADGAHSSVRDALGVEMRGPDHLYEGVTAVIHAPLWDVVGAHRYGLYAATLPEANGTFFPAGRPDRWVYAFGWEPHELPRLDVSALELTQRITLGAGVDHLPVTIDRIGDVVFAAKLADTFRRGQVFLVGDAAHRVSPRGGTGMNTAIQGAFDLAWKLAWVLRGWAGDDLLDTYEIERRPIVEHNVARSIERDGSIRPAADELLVDLAGRIAHVWVPDGGASAVSTIDLVGDGLTLFTSGSSRDWDPLVSSLDVAVPVAVRPLPTVTARALGLRPGGALLVRPDGGPVAAWSRMPRTSGALAATIAECSRDPTANDVSARVA